MTDAPITISAAEYARLRAAVDRLDRRPTATTEPAVCCDRQGCCHVTRDEHGYLMGREQPMPPNRPSMED